MRTRARCCLSCSCWAPCKARDCRTSVMRSWIVAAWCRPAPCQESWEQSFENVFQPVAQVNWVQSCVTVSSLLGCAPVTVFQAGQCVGPARQVAAAVLLSEQRDPHLPRQACTALPDAVRRGVAL